MNTSVDDNSQLRYAEYVLGVLDADARAAVAHEVASGSEAALAVALWQARLLPLTESIDEAVPPAYVWARISDALQFTLAGRASSPSASAPRPGWWDNLSLWRWLGIGASIATAALVVVVSLPRLAPVANVAPGGYMASTIQQDNGRTGWTATMDPQHARMIVVPATPVAFESGRAPELWLIPAGGKPISVGMIALDRPTALVLDPALVAQLGPSAVLAVSVEPTGGSPTGQPTGAVIAKGAIGAAPDAGGNNTAMRADPQAARRRA